MSKRLIVVLALLFVVGTTFAAYAEVQNVKVSGDINILGVSRTNFDLTNPAAGIPKEDDHQRFFATQTRVKIDADLTDNVMATVRLINERDWNAESTSNTNIALDLAYVTLKEFLYSPLTLTLGRQELRFGNTLIIGNARNFTTGSIGNLPADLSERKAFDAIRATLNYDPLVIDAVYAKMNDSNSIASSASNDLFGVNVSYDVSKKINVQGYIWNTKDKSAAVVNSKKNDIYTLGGLVTVKPIDDLKASLEGAWQFGKNRIAAGTGDNKRKAFAAQAMIDYTFSKVKFTPAIGAGYTYLSGGDKNAAWNAMYYDQRLGNIAYAILPFSNLSVINLQGSMKPMDDVTLMAKYGNYRFAKRQSSITSNYSGTAISTNGKGDLGNEIDITALYDYTEDVQFGLTAGCFMLGTAFDNSLHRDATQVIGSMKVTF